MNAIRKRIEDLHRYMPPLTNDPAALDRFWDAVSSRTGAKPLNSTVRASESPMCGVDVYHVSYEGFDDTPIHGWYLVPAFLKQDKYPCVVIYQGYTENKGLPERYAPWLLLGYAVFAVDPRGQGGETGNRLDYDGGGIKGWITQNITDKDRCYYLALAVDSAKAVDWVSGRHEIDCGKIAVMGASQGGGLALLATAINDKVSLTIADIPNLCHLDFGIMNSTGSLTEAAEYVKRNPALLEIVLDTLSYFDIMNLAHRIRVPVHFSVGLKDTVCWPETIFAAYNRIAGEKTIEVHPFSGHEVGEYQQRLTMERLKRWAQHS